MQPYKVDADALDVLGDRLIIAVGVESGEGPAARGGRAVAALLGRRSVDLPGDHGSFLDSSYGEPPGPTRARPGCGSSSTPDRRRIDADRSPAVGLL